MVKAKAKPARPSGRTTPQRWVHRVLCWFGAHVDYESFRYAPQGFESTVYKVTYRCAVCGRQRSGTQPYGEQ